MLAGWAMRRRTITPIPGRRISIWYIIASTSGFKDRNPDDREVREPVFRLATLLELPFFLLTLEALPVVPDFDFFLLLLAIENLRMFSVGSRGHPDFRA